MKSRARRNVCKQIVPQKQYTYELPGDEQRAILDAITLGRLSAITQVAERPLTKEEIEALLKTDKNVLRLALAQKCAAQELSNDTQSLKDITIHWYIAAFQQYQRAYTDHPDQQSQDKATLATFYTQGRHGWRNAYRWVYQQSIIDIQSLAGMNEQVAI